MTSGSSSSSAPRTRLKARESVKLLWGCEAKPLDMLSAISQFRLTKKFTVSMRVVLSAKGVHTAVRVISWVTGSMYRLSSSRSIPLPGCTTSSVSPTRHPVNR